MSSVIKFILWVAILITVISAQSFNVFKSYKNAKVRPASYSKRRRYWHCWYINFQYNIQKLLIRQHALREYLDSTQLQMLAKRVGPTSPADTFTDNWSGIDRRIKMRPINSANIADKADPEQLRNTAFRRLRGSISSDSSENIYESFETISEPTWYILVFISIFLFISISYSVAYAFK